MSKSPHRFQHFSLLLLDLNLDLFGDGLSALLAISGLPVHGFPPRIYLVFFINCDRVVGSTCNIADGILSQGLYVFVFVVLEEVGNQVRGTHRLHALEQA